MRNNVVKVLILGMLIIVCIGQIVTLWLGNVSSRNFLEEKIIQEEEAGIKPKIIWANTGLAYKISENNREYSMLTRELQHIVAAGGKAMEIEKNTEADYEALFSMPAIIYEYGLDLTLEQVIGSKLPKYEEEMVLNQLVVDVDASNEGRVFLYLVSKEGQVIHKVTLYNKLESHAKLLTRLNDQDVASGFTVYQPSMTSEKKQFIKGNVFLPLSSKETPMSYEVLTVSNPIEALDEEKKIEVLESYVKSFFVNPLLKQIDKKEDGSVIFSENRRAIVKYNPIGTLEFNSTSASEASNLNKLERLKKIKSFISTSTGIPEALKKGIYISQISKVGEDYIYRFDYKYNGFKLQLREDVKKQLGLENVLELTIRNNQVTKGKWILLSIETATEQGMGASNNIVSRGYGEIIDRMYVLTQKDASSKMALDRIECSYIMDHIEGNLRMDWIVAYGNRWYYP